MTSPFAWRNTPATITKDRHYNVSPSGKSNSQTASEAVTRKTIRTGRSPGSINGLSRRGDDHIISQPPHRGHLSGRVCE